MKIQDKIKNFWSAYGAALWAIIFALVHLAWAGGWYIGLDEKSASAAFERKWFLIYDIVAAVLCSLAAALALSFAYRWRHRSVRLAVGWLGWCCAGILTLRGVAGMIAAIYLIIGDKSPVPAVSFWDLWFCLGAILFIASVIAFSNRKRQ